MDVLAQDDIKIFVLPETGRCITTGVSPLDMLCCPINKYGSRSICRPGECEYYVEGVIKYGKEC